MQKEDRKVFEDRTGVLQAAWQADEVHPEPERGERKEMQEQFDKAVAVSRVLLKFY